jgi:hypothetical protein
MHPASKSVEVQLEPDHPPVQASQRRPPTGQRVHQFQPAAAGRLQVARSALRRGEHTGGIDLSTRSTRSRSSRSPLLTLNPPPAVPEDVWRSALVVTSLTNSRATSRIGES